MSVPVPDPDDREEPRPSLLERLTAFLTREPEDRGELLDLLRGAFERRLLDADALSMIEGVLQVSEMSVRDVMIPRSQMDCVSIDDEPDAFIPLVIETKHSRFPVIGESKDDVVGILLAKELLNYYRNPEGFTLRDTLRPAGFIPESKRLNVLLREFRSNRNHIAIVVDEYEDNILADKNGRFRVKAQTEVGDFNGRFGSHLSDDAVDTVGGLVVHAFGRLPKRGETVSIGEFRFRVVRADSRRIHTLQVEKFAPEAAKPGL